MRSGVVALAACLLAPLALAQVEVMEPGAQGSATAYEPTQSRQVATQQRPSSSQGGSSGELFNQLQMFQEEMMKLRGIVEEQGEQLRQLKQQRLDDYISLDKRISALGGAPAPSAVQPSSGADAGVAASVDAQPQVAAAPLRASTTVPTAAEEQGYQDAYALVRNRDFAGATAAFEVFLSQYSNGAYAGNGHYWLGELYLLDGDSTKAREHFEALINDFPDNRKVPDGMFKLGRIYHQEGDTKRAREILQRVVSEYANSDSSAPRLANEYLQRNF